MRATMMRATMIRSGAIFAMLCLASCSSETPETAALNATSSQDEIEAVANTIEEAADKAAALIEADANAEITAQEITETKSKAAPASVEGNQAAEQAQQ